MIKFIAKRYKFVLLFAWMLVIFLLSNEPSGVSTGRSDLIVGAVSSTLHLTLSQEVMTFLVRKLAHTIAYFVLGVLIFNIAKDLKFKNAKFAVAASVAFAFLYAITDELHQLFVRGRSCELRDVIIDTVAATIGVCLYYLICRLTGSKHELNLHKQSK